MATVLPPPSKRQRVAVEERARHQQDLDTIPSFLGSIRVQFFDQTNGSPTGPAVAIPVIDATVKNLETLLNTLQGNDESDRVPYRFSYLSSGPDSNTVDISSDLYHTLLKPGFKTTEEIISLHYTPQAVFKVRAVSRCSASISGHGEPILAAAFSPASSSILATGSGDSTARIWDCNTGTPIHTLKGHTSWVLAVSWSPDASTIATGSHDSTVRLWNPKTGQPIHSKPLKGHSKWINSIAWEPYHIQQLGLPRLASASKDSTIRIWNSITGITDIVLSGHKDSVTGVKWGGTNPSKLYTSSLDRTIKIWDPTKGTLIQTLTSHAHRVNHLALSTDFVLRTAFHDHTGTIPPTNSDKLSLAQSRFLASATINSTITERLVSASDDLVIYIHDPSNPSKKPIPLHGHQKPINHVTFSPDGLTIASASFDNHIKLWSARDGKFLHTLRGHVAAVYQVCFSADSRLLVSASKDTTIKVWDVRTGTLKSDLPGHADEVFAVDWSPDGERVGSGGKDKHVRIWRS